MFTLIITTLELISVILDKITLLERLKFFIYIKRMLNFTIKTCDKHHKKGKRMRKNKSNKIVIWLILLCILNFLISGVLYYKVRQQENKIDNIIIVVGDMLYNNKNFQNNLKDKDESSFNKNLAESY